MKYVNTGLQNLVFQLTISTTAHSKAGGIVGNSIISEVNNEKSNFAGGGIIGLCKFGFCSSQYHAGKGF